jgi:DNA-binding NtrC family response regulator
MSVTTPGKEAQSDGNRAADPRSNVNPPRATIAILDDDDFYRNSLRRVLRSEGFAVLEAGDVGSLESLLEHHAVDIIVADSRLPDGDGWARAKDLAAKYHHAITVVPVSGYDVEAIVQTGGEAEPVFTEKSEGRFIILRAVEAALTR